ncbi:putative C6 transcription factor [Aspergillus alliaceus]|uniref:putative C6 transcription factor n=1 Tax=Petromyces alliaceus TaxID=209559 RepID=UPI0012A3DC38|nr:fungal-specific transcription factor domain-containing protein [Aspergillus alliaceus]KAB8237483.1 fungal-specific transcription factor domain-containing protein [Aspergillus alliaceus]
MSNAHVQRSSAVTAESQSLERPNRLLGRKRKRVSVACRSCRVRKSRCDGAQPCSTCEDTETECMYEQAHSRPAVETVTDRVEQRLLAIEQKLQRLGQEARVDWSPEAATSIPPNGKLTLDDGVDGMGAVMLEDEGEESEYFGNSSNVSFLRFIIHATSHCVTRGDGPSNLTQDSTDATGGPRDDDFDGFLQRPPDESPSSLSADRGVVERFSFPPPAEADGLLQIYFTTVNLMMPCIHEASFLGTYRKMRNNELPDIRRSWLGVLNIIFAIATNLTTATTPTSERATRSRMYFERAMEVTKSDIVGRVSLELELFFLLVYSYLEGTTSASLAWTFHSLAVKGAYQLGLHGISSKGLSQIDQELRRRLWYWCVMNDRLLSASYGRPPLIPLSHARINKLVHLPFNNVPSGVIMSSIEYFDALMSLTHIVGGAVDKLYDQNLGSQIQLPINEVVERINRLTWQLATWQDGLPACLSIITSQDILEDVPLTIGTPRLRVLLSLRYLGTRILILRPILPILLDLSKIAALDVQQSMWVHGPGSLLLADLIRAISDILRVSENILAGAKKDQNLLGAWWFSCYYTFNASLATIGVLLTKRVSAFPDRLPDVSYAHVRSLLDSAKDILRGLGNSNRTVVRCHNILTKLLTSFDLEGNTFMIHSIGDRWT